MNEKLAWKIFWVMIAVLSLISIAIAIISYYLSASQHDSAVLEAIKMFLLCIGGTGVIVSIYFSGLNIYLQRKFSIMENTFHLLLRWDDEHYLNARQWTRNIKKEQNDLSPNELIAKIEQNPELEQSVILVLNYLEHVRVSLVNGRIDKEVFRHSLGETLIGIAQRFKPYAIKLNEINQEHLEQLIDELKIKSQLTQNT